MAAIYSKAMPVVLTKPDEIEAWLTAPAEEALKLQRANSDGEVVEEEQQIAPESLGRSRRHV